MTTTTTQHTLDQHNSHLTPIIKVSNGKSMPPFKFSFAELDGFGREISKLAGLKGSEGWDQLIMGSSNGSVSDKHVDHGLQYIDSETPLHLIPSNSSSPAPLLTNHNNVINSSDIRRAGGSSPSPRWELKGYFPLLKMVVAEMVGTLFLMFCICGVSMGDTISHGGLSLMGHAVAASFTIMVIIFSIGHISGAHVNPAVTLAFAAMRQFPWWQVPYYVGAQLLGGVIGVVMAKAMYKVGGEVVITQPIGSVVQSFFMETFISFDFMFLASAVTSDARATGLQAAISMALIVALNILIAGPISGASMNPVRSLAPAIVQNHYRNAWIYIIAPPLGALCGALFYKTLHL